MSRGATELDPYPPLNPRLLFTALGFLILLAVGFFADGVRVRLEARDASSLPPVETGVPRLTRRVVFVLLDSIPIRVGTDPTIMPNLIALGRRGASGVLIAPAETVSTTGVRAMTVGTSPSFRDTLDTFSQRRFPHWTVFDDISRRGEGVLFEGDHIWHDLLGDRSKENPAPAAARNLYANDAASLAAARRALLSPSSPAFLSLHVDRTDYFAHQFGTRSGEYKRRLREVDDEIGRFLQEIDDGATTVIVTSDHGCDEFGSHGGSGEIYRRVPVILAGAGVEPIHGFEMDAMQMPLVLATLLGTRLPGGVLDSPPDAFLAMDPGSHAKLAVANVHRIRAIAAFREIDLPREIDASIANAERALKRQTPEDTIRLSRIVGQRLLEAVRTGSRPDPGAFLWVAVFALATALTFLASATSVAGFAHALALGSALLIPLWISSALRIPVLSALAVVLLVALGRAFAGARGSGRRPSGIFVGAVATILLAASAVRFLHGGAALMRAARPLAVAAAVLAVAALVVFRKRLPEVGRAAARSEAWLIASVVFALGILQPLEAIPVVLVGLLVVGMRAAGVRWLATALAGAAAACFFLAGQRFVFGLLGERVWPRYTFTAIAGVLGLALLAFVLDRATRWIPAAMACLVPLWPFGYLVTSAVDPASPTHVGLVVLPWLGAVAFAWRSGVLFGCAAPLLTAVAYRLAPGQSAFLVSLVAHLAALIVIPLKRFPRSRKRSAAACLVFSMLFVMSSDVDTISLTLVALSLLALSRIEIVDLPVGTLALLAGAILGYLRFVIIDLFGHTPGMFYTLGELDTHAGFVTMSRDVSLWWSTTLVVWKLVCGSVLLILLAFSCRWVRRVEGRVVLASIAAVLALALQTSLELALSYGVNESRSSVSMVLVVFHAGTVVLIASGYLVSRVLLARATAEPAGAEIS